ncbi:hypothetical protein UABAM_02372 [Candidatus Uabimicrobium amorphum]|uniref:Uncharacterized protein n=1 Tax=Uabimicrobium amorphum TaxID=2596890 RepID=A0A5S9IM23_UABAM|nr:hypothetical protein UABAM_02372 [Candidatus Uabimicrobium amorphum]
MYTCIFGVDIFVHSEHKPHLLFEKGDASFLDLATLQ